MAAESTRHPREEPFLPGDRDGVQGLAAGNGETLAEKIRRHRQAGGGSPGAAPGPGSRIVRHPRED